MTAAALSARSAEAPNHRFLTLDALRGVAALVVVLHHAVNVIRPWNPPGGYLPVDFFFVLSGFVIGRGYDGKIDAGMTRLEFVKRRIHRLYPLYLFGAVLAIIDGAVAWKTHHGLQWPSMAAFLSSAALTVAAFPTPPQISHHGTLYPFNSSFWSLMFEFLANVVFITCWRLFKGRALYALIAVCGLGVIAGCFIHRSADVGSSYPDAVLAFPRVGYSFFMGVALNRLRLGIRVPAWVVYVLPMAVFLCPIPAILRPAFDAAAVLAVFPLTVVLGSNVEPTGWRATAAKFVLGGPSYAIYALHEPIYHGLDMVLRRLGLEPTRWIGGYMLLLLAVVLAVAFVVNLADERVRRQIKKLGASPPRQREAIAAE